MSRKYALGGRYRALGLQPVIAYAMCASVPIAVLTPKVAHADPPTFLERSIVANAMHRAVARAGLGPEVTRDLAVRARAAGWLPHLSLRVARGFGASSAATQTFTTTEHTATDDSLMLDVRVQVALDRVVFDHNEVPIARVELTRSERRAALEREVIEVLASLEIARADVRRLAPASPESVRANIEFARARARIEGLTGVSLNELTSTR